MKTSFDIILHCHTWHQNFCCRDPGCMTLAEAELQKFFPRDFAHCSTSTYSFLLGQCVIPYLSVLRYKHPLLEVSSFFPLQTRRFATWRSLFDIFHLPAPTFIFKQVKVGYLHVTLFCLSVMSPSTPK